MSERQINEKTLTSALFKMAVVSACQGTADFMAMLVVAFEQPIKYVFLYVGIHTVFTVIQQKWSPWPLPDVGYKVTTWWREGIEIGLLITASFGGLYSAASVYGADFANNPAPPWLGTLLFLMALMNTGPFVAHVWNRVMPYISGWTVDSALEAIFKAAEERAAKAQGG